MNEYKRQFPVFALCGLNCGLCPRYHTEGISKCPGCGGVDFHLKHPTCAVITCNKKHDTVEFCFQCSSFPCDRYKETSKNDSFITYQHVLSDFEKAKKNGLQNYIHELTEKIKIVEYLIKNYNDGKKKNFYCLAVNLFDLKELRSILKQADDTFATDTSDNHTRTKCIVDLIKKRAKQLKIELQLRNK